MRVVDTSGFPHLRIHTYFCKTRDGIYFVNKNFSIGFLRLCLQFKKPIVPVAIVGAEEMYPFVVQAPWIAKLLKLPSMPITPLFPFTGLFGMIPLPAPIDIYYGSPIMVDNKYTADDPDHVLKSEVERIQGIIQKMVRDGLHHKRPILDDELKNNMKGYYEKFRERLKLVKEFLDQDKNKKTDHGKV